MSRSLIETQADIKDSLQHLVESFGLFRLPLLPKPKPEEWPAFIREHPDYLDGYQTLAMRIANSDKEVLDGLDINYQRLAGTLIRTCLDNEEIMAWAK